jgi:hypothetical protein
MVSDNLRKRTDMTNNSNGLPKWVWWTKGECVVEILSIGHFPTTVMAKLPSDKETEIDMDELDLTKGVS